MKNFQYPETIILGIAAKKGGVLSQPNVSMTISIFNPVKVTLVDKVSMDYHSTPVTIDGLSCNHTYDFVSTAVLGTYRVRYIATNGTRVTVKEDAFTVK